MTTINTISEFLLEAGTEYRVFDMGRTIKPLDEQTFLEIENNQIPAPNPRLSHAWFGMLFWNKQLSEQHYIWFLKLPLDERGLLVCAARNHFLGIILESLGTQFLEAPEPNSELPDNPYTFAPSQQILADFNSLSRSCLSMPTSNHLSLAKNYLMTPEKVDWRTIPLQGVSDLALKLVEPQLSFHFEKNFTNLEPTVLQHLLTSLENYPLSDKVFDLLYDQLMSAQEPDEQLLLLCRAISRSMDESQFLTLLRELKRNERLTQEMLMVMSGRCWRFLENDDIALEFMEETAQQNLFAAVFADLVQVPLTRNAMLKLLRSEHRSEALASAIGAMFSRS